MSSAACGAVVLAWDDRWFNLIEDLFSPGYKHVFDVVDMYNSEQKAFCGPKLLCRLCCAGNKLGLGPVL